MCFAATDVTLFIISLLKILQNIQNPHLFSNSFEAFSSYASLLIWQKRLKKTTPPPEVPKPSTQSEYCYFLEVKP